MGRSIEKLLYFINNPHHPSQTCDAATGSQVDGRHCLGIRKVIIILFSLALIWISLTPSTPAAHAAVWTAVSCNRSDIQAQITNASDGDTVIVPAGICGWNTSTLTVSKAITLQGGGVGITIIQDNYADTTTDITVTAVPNQVTRITGFTFQRGTRTGGTIGNSFIQVNGNNMDGGKVRIDHNRFYQPNVLRHIFVNGAIGVTDHNTFLPTSGSTQFTHYIDHQSWNGNSHGDGAWVESAQWGTDRFWFIEDNTINYATVVSELIDSCGGARWVVRHNTVTNSRLVAHGTESTTRPRGTRAVEVYNNTFTGSGSTNEMFELRSGSLLIHDNTYLNWGPYLTGVATFKTFRATDDLGGWGGADGKNMWDENQAGGPFAFGTHYGPDGSFGLTDTTKSWTVNQWTGYALKNTTRGTFSQIDSNTATTITYKAGLFGNMTFNNTDSYQIYKVNTILDQPGMGAGSLVSGNPPTPPVGWNNQATDPAYQWNNMYGATSLVFATAYENIRATVHYFDNKQPPGYVPYTYPHPLVSGSGAADPPPAAPTNVTVK